jgi:catechol 2,3-dioxygenase-like lactoylglutathione lyase family enzyme
MADHEPFEYGGVNHIALVCRDMARTVDFYTNVLDMPLVKTIDLPGGGQHFFFDCGGGNCVAFFWFPDAPEPVPGVQSPAAMPGTGSLASAPSSMNHLAFHVPADRFEGYRDRLIERGVEVSPIVDHDDSPSTIARTFHDGVFIRSMYFFDPDGILLEFAVTTRAWTPEDVRHAPAGAAVAASSGTATGSG